MNKKIMTLGLLALAATTQTFAQGEYNISGETGKADFNGKVYAIDAINRRSIDTIDVKDGKYTMTGKVETPTLVYVYSQEAQSMSAFILEPGTYSITNGCKTADSGTLNLAYKEYLDAQQAISESNEGTEDERDAKAAKATEEFFAKHNNDILGVLALQSMMYSVDAKTLLQLVDNSGDFVKNSSLVKSQTSNWIAQSKTSKGDMFVDFSAEYDGKKVSLSDYVGKGKYVLVDFWASWCGPCRKEIPHIAELYKKYKGDKFEVLGVATWDKPEATKKAIDELGVVWPQMLNAQKAGSDAYGISGIPQIILFAPDGKIVARDLRGDAMKAAVEKTMSE